MIVSSISCTPTRTLNTDPVVHVGPVRAEGPDRIGGSVVSQLLSNLTNAHGVLVYLAIGAVVFLEAALFVGMVFPGETALLLGGVLAQRGHVSLAGLLVLGTVAAVAGDSVGYVVGRRLGPAAQRSRAGRWVGEVRWAHAHRFVRRHGWWAVLLGRWVAVLRALVPAVVGMARMPYRRFLPANVTGGVTWVVTIVLIGDAVGNGASRSRLLAGLTLGAAAIAAVAVVTAMIGERRRRRERTRNGHEDHRHAPARVGGVDVRVVGGGSPALEGDVVDDRDHGTEHPRSDTRHHTGERK